MAHIDIKPLTDSENERLAKSFIPIREQGQVLIRTVPGNCILPAAYEKYKDQFFNFNLQASDVYILTYPKNGTTWTQELVWCVQNDADIETASKVPLPERSPFLDLHFIRDFAASRIGSTVGEPGFEDVFEKVEQMKSPRNIKTHLPFCLIPEDIFEKSKVVMCLRNPKDTVVSYFHHEKLMKFHGFSGDFQTYFDLFMDDLIFYGSYWDYTLKAWGKKDHPNVCLLFFEDMKKDLASSIRKVAAFLQKDINDGQIESLVEHLSFKKMKENRAVNKESIRRLEFNGPEGSFIRKGEVGDWKNYFTEEMNQRMDKAIEQHFKGTGLQFRYE